MRRDVTSANDDHQRWHELLAALTADPVFEEARRLRIEGLDAWPILKSTLVMTLLNRMQHGVPKRKVLHRLAHKAVQHLGRIGRAEPAIINAAEIQNCEALFLGNIAPAVEIDGITANPHFDPLRYALAGRNVATLAMYYDLPVASSYRFLGRSVGCQLQGGSFSGNRALAPRLDQRLAASLKPARKLLHRFGLDDCQSLSHRLALTIGLRDGFRRMLEASGRLRMLFLTNYYGVHGWAAIAAARDLGLPSVDIQHGVQGPFHHAYGWAELGGTPLNVLPDRYLCWTEQDRSHLERQELTAGASLVSGPSHFQLAHTFKAGKGADSEFCAARTAYDDAARKIDLLAEKDHRDGRFVVGLFQQYRERPDWVAELRRRLPDSVALWVRRHPGARGVRPGVGTPTSLPLREMDGAALPAILRNIDLAVTAYSSIGIEAAHVGCPVLSYSPFANEFLHDHCWETGLGISSHEPAVLACEILRVLERRQPRPAERPLPNLDDIVAWLLP